MNLKTGLFLVLFLIFLSFLPFTFVFENNESSELKKQELLYSESVNRYLGPHNEKYRQDFPVEVGASNIEVRLLVTEFDSDDYGKIRLTLYDTNNRPVANDTFYQLEKYVNVKYENVSPGDWHIVVSVEKELGFNSVNVGGNINVFGRAVNSTV